MPTLRGNQLRPDVQRDALARFVHRFTKDHAPSWSRANYKGGAYPVQFASDLDWLANTEFAVTKSGDLDNRMTHCTSYPTWPDNPELRGARVVEA